MYFIHVSTHRSHGEQGMNQPINDSKNLKTFTPKLLFIFCSFFFPFLGVTDFPVQNFRGRGVSSTTVQLQWDPPAQGEGTYSHFMLSFSSSEGDRDTKLPEGGILPSSVRSYVVR